MDKEDERPLSAAMMRDLIRRVIVMEDALSWDYTVSRIHKEIVVYRRGTFDPDVRYSLRHVLTASDNELRALSRAASVLLPAVKHD